MAVDFARTPAMPLPRPIEIEPLDPSLPRINTRAELEKLFSGSGTGTDLLKQGEQWLQERGYPSRWFDTNRSPSPTEEMLAAADDAELLILAGRGYLPAIHKLALRSLNERSDPLEALEWYDQAIVNGSLFAMARVADLLMTLSQPELSQFNSDQGWQNALEQIQQASPAPLERALAWQLAAVIVGGYPVLDLAAADKISVLTNWLDFVAVSRACETAQTYVLEAAATRRAQGGAVFSLGQPQFAISVADPVAAIPCTVPIVPLVTMDGCSSIDFVAPGEVLMRGWVCSE
jgi:hypothetical protein